MTEEVATPPPSAGKTLIIIAGVALAIAGYIALGMLLGIHALFAGFVFLLYWTAIKHADPRAFTPGVLGAVAGLALAWALMHAGTLFGTAGVVAAMVVLIGAIYLYIRQQLGLVVNLALMLFLTVGTIPPLAAENDYPGLILGVLYGAAYFGGLVYLGTRLAQRRGAATAA